MGVGGGEFVVSASNFFGEHRGDEREVFLDFGDGFLGFGSFAELEVGEAEPDPWGGVVGIEFGGFLIGFDRALVIALRVIDVAEVVPRGNEVGFEFEGAFVGGSGTVEFVQRRIGVAEGEPGVGVARIEFENLKAVGDEVLVTTFAFVDVGDAGPGGEVVGVGLGEFAVKRFEVVVGPTGMGEVKIIPDMRVVGMEVEELASERRQVKSIRWIFGGKLEEGPRVLVSGMGLEKLGAKRDKLGVPSVLHGQRVKARPSAGMVGLELDFALVTCDRPIHEMPLHRESRKRLACRGGRPED